MALVISAGTAERHQVVVNEFVAGTRPCLGFPTAVSTETLQGRMGIRARRILIMAQKSIAKKGLVIVYIGRGKGKTTAAIGLAVRALGAGLNVYIVQFIKGEWPSGERDFFSAVKTLQRRYKGQKQIGEMEFIAAGKGFVKILGDRKPFSTHVAAARQALKLGRQAVRSRKYDVVILDEALSAVENKLLKENELTEVVREKPSSVHLIITGHKALKWLIKLADLVSDVKMVKHPYYNGILAQRGIDY